MIFTPDCSLTMIVLAALEYDDHGAFGYANAVCECIAAGRYVREGVLHDVAWMWKRVRARWLARVMS